MHGYYTFVSNNTSLTISYNNHNWIVNLIQLSRSIDFRSVANSADRKRFSKTREKHVVIEKKRKNLRFSFESSRSPIVLTWPTPRAGFLDGDVKKSGTLQSEGLCKMSKNTVVRKIVYTIYAILIFRLKRKSECRYDFINFLWNVYFY